MTTPKFVLFKSTNNNNYYWNFKAANSEKVCQSEGYTTKDNAINGIYSLINSIQKGNCEYQDLT